jgi:hypothetical protein
MDGPPKREYLAHLIEILHQTQLSLTSSRQLIEQDEAAAAIAEAPLRADLTSALTPERRCRSVDPSCVALTSSLEGPEAGSTREKGSIADGYETVKLARVQAIVKHTQRSIEQSRKAIERNRGAFTERPFSDIPLRLGLRQDASRALCLLRRYFHQRLAGTPDGNAARRPRTSFRRCPGVHKAPAS